MDCPLPKKELQLLPSAPLEVDGRVPKPNASTHASHTSTALAVKPPRDGMWRCQKKWCALCVCCTRA